MVTFPEKDVVKARWFSGTMEHVNIKTVENWRYILTQLTFTILTES